MTDAKPPRWPAIDLLRGLTVAVMILVNQWAGVAGLPDWMKHYPADADAMSFVDMVFPAFLFIVGMAIPLALQKRGPAALPAVALRTAGLLLLGLAMVNAEMAPGAWHWAQAWLLAALLASFLVWGSVRGGPPLNGPWRMLGLVLLLVLALLYPRNAAGGIQLQVHWWGILGLIGWAFALSALLQLLSPPAARLPLSLLLLAVCIVWRIQIDPLVGGGAHATHTALTLAGMCSTLVLMRCGSRAWQWLLPFALLLLAAGFALRPGLGISKIHATPAWGLLCAGASLLLYLAADALQRHRPGLFAALLRPLQQAGQHPLLAYLLPYVLGGLAALVGLHWPHALSEGWAGVLRGVAFLGWVLLCLRVLLHHGVRLRL